VVKKKSKGLFIFSVNTHKFKEVEENCFQKGCLVLQQHFVDSLFEQSWGFTSDVKQRKRPFTSVKFIVFSFRGVIFNW